MKVHVNVDRSEGFAVAAELDVGARETLALVGPNGAGKTTTLMAIAGLLGPETVMRAEDGGRVGVVFQDGLLFPHLSVRENVSFMAAGDVDELMVELGIDHLADQKPDSLSGGESQRVALARTLATEPDVLLLDEPMSALDVTAKAEMRRFLKTRLEAFSGPVVLVAHDPIDALGLADHVCVMEKGRIVQKGTPEQLRLRPATRYVADLVGTNLLEGTASAGVVSVDGHKLRTADHETDGEVLVQVHPRAVSIHPHVPSGSARNVWQTTISNVEVIGEVARIGFDTPVSLTAEVTFESVDSLGLSQGLEVYVAIKATEVEVRPSR